MYLTQKQIQIMATIVKANPDGSYLDLDQLVENLPYRTTKESMHFSLRALIKKGLLEKKPQEVRRGRVRNIIAPTLLGLETMHLHTPA